MNLTLSHFHSQSHTLHQFSIFHSTPPTTKRRLKIFQFWFQVHLPTDFWKSKEKNVGGQQQWRQLNTRAICQIEIRSYVFLYFFNCRHTHTHISNNNSPFLVRGSSFRRQLREQARPKKRVQILWQTVKRSRIKIMMKLWMWPEVRLRVTLKTTTILPCRKRSLRKFPRTPKVWVWKVQSYMIKADEALEVSASTMDSQEIKTPTQYVKSNTEKTKSPVGRSRLMTQDSDQNNDSFETREHQYG